MVNQRRVHFSFVLVRVFLIFKMELIFRTLEIPFYFLRVPNLKLRTPHLPQISAMTVFALVFLSYFLVSAGIIYDIIAEPHSIGSVTDEATGATKPVVFMKHRVNGQFIIEGLAAGFLFSIGGLGIILLDRSNQKSISDRSRYLLIGLGIACLVIGYNLCILFLHIKIPGYQA